MWCFLTETWLQSDKNAITAEIQTYGYKLWHDRRKDREKQTGGGVGILVKFPLISKQLPVVHYTSFEHTVVKITLAKKKLLYLVSVYRLQYVSLTTFMDEFSELLDLYMISNDLCVIAGDINIHVETHNADAKKFKELLDLYDLDQHVDVPTHVKGHTLDVVITPKKDGFLSNVNVTHIDLSHHSLIDFKLMAEATVRKQKVITYRSLKNVDLAVFGKRTCHKRFLE